MISIMRAGPQAERWLKVYKGQLRARRFGCWLVVRDWKRFEAAYGSPDGLLG
jgi:hypothetical protein